MFLKRIQAGFKKLLRTGKPEPVVPAGPKQPKVRARSPKENELALGFEYSRDSGGPEGAFTLRGVDQKYRSTHFYVVGATGMGKTKFLENLILHDIVHERGFGVIDPHGDLAEDVKGWLWLYSKKSLRDDVVLIEPTDPRKTVVFNPLEKINGMSAADVAAELVWAFKKIWHDSWGARMENILRNSLVALSEAGLTLAEIPLLLTDRAFRKKVLEKVKNPICRQYFSQSFEPLSPKTKSEWIESTLNKVDAFLSNDIARPVLSGKKSTFNLREIIDRRKILLVNLDKGRLKDASELLGSLLMSKIKMAAFTRSDTPRDRRIPFYLYIDEFQNLAGDNFKETLAEARKYGLSLIIAHQFLSQLAGELRDSVLTNCGIQVYFRLARRDADLLAKEGFRITGTEIKDMRIGRDGVSPIYFSYSEEWEKYIKDLQDLPPERCSVIHKIEGEALTLDTVPVASPWEAAKMAEEAFREEVRKEGIGGRYLKNREAIEKAYRRRQEKLAAPEEPETFREPKNPSAGQGKNPEKTQRRQRRGKSV